MISRNLVNLRLNFRKNAVDWNGVEEEEAATDFKLEDGTERKASNWKRKWEDIKLKT
jgi:hypothetical protein